MKPITPEPIEPEGLNWTTTLNIITLGLTTLAFLFAMLSLLERC
jgi:hypothetical protein